MRSAVCVALWWFQCGVQKWETDFAGQSPPHDFGVLVAARRDHRDRPPNMSRYGGPKLPKTLLDQVGGSGAGKGRHNASRKDRRKGERQQTKLARANPRQTVHKVSKLNRQLDLEYDDIPAPRKASIKPTKEARPLKSILKKKSGPIEPATISAPEELRVISGQDSEVSEDGDSDESDTGSLNISRDAAKAGLEDNEDEITALERKLGIKGSKRSKDVGDEELDWLVAGSDSEDELRSFKRKRPDDSKWLRDKRLKASDIAQPPSSEDASFDDGTGVKDAEGDSNQSDAEDELENPFSEDEVDSDDFGSFDSGEEYVPALPLAKKQRENPYVAPVAPGSAPTAGKYVPPSLRKPASSDEEVLKQLRRQLQGLLNRLSEANLVSILQSVEELYAKNARQHVTSTLIELLSDRVGDSSALNDTFLILHAGFATGIYKVIGTDFGAQLLEAIVDSIDKHRAQASEGKQTVNLMSFLAILYTLGMIGPAIVFDFIRSFLDDLSESNTELLLRVIRTSGAQLRLDDPSSLKDIVLIVQRSASAIGEGQLSVRTKFMIETINNLKNNRMKTGQAASAVAAEHTNKMKKALGSLNTRSNLKATEPLRISLSDIRDTEKKGKWWLVGASYHDPAKLAKNNETLTSKSRQDDDAGYESETPGHVSLTKLARSQGMNTDVRRAIFISILSASDYKDAHLRLLKLHLKSKQELEIPRVLLHCVGAEKVYNPYYTLIARKLCGENKYKKAFRFALWDAFKRMDSRNDADVDDNDSDVEQLGSEAMSLSKIVNLAKMYGTLIADGGLSVTILKTLEFAYLSTKAAQFAEVLFTTVILQAHRKGADDKFERMIKDVFAQAAAASGMIQGLQYFVTTTVSKTGVANGKRERQAVRSGCDYALESLTQAASAVAPVVDDSDLSD